VRLLLDTQAFLWHALNDRRLSAKAGSLIADPNNILEFSPASYWEIAIKISIGKYNLNQPFQDFMDQQIKDNDLRILPVQVHHVAALVNLPFHHKDPFDRLLVAQALVEQVPIVSNDSALDQYPITRMW